MYSVVYKIFKFLDDRDKTQISRIIRLDNGSGAAVVNGVGLANKLQQIYQIVRPIVVARGIQRDEDRQEFIAGKIQDYLQIEPGARTRFLDIGGGNGNILSGLQTRLGGARDDYICVENQSNWQENYQYSNENIRYLFWNNQELPGVMDGSVDIVFCMVSLHHMTNGTIGNILAELYRVLKPSSKLLIKEHAAATDNLKYIYWEHHLYHVLDVAMTDGANQSGWQDYLERSINNFKPADEWRSLCEEHGFKFVERMNRFLEGGFESDPRNPSELYWDVYTR
jgi:ubiquinone/menaquinone biosynthesis C-methylase UbiE